MKKVNFTEMKNGTKEDYQLLEKYEKNYERQTAERILKYLSAQTTTLEGYQITRLEHSLQAATRAYKNGEDEEMVVATLLHDIGDDLAPMNHSQYAASILKPYVSEKTYWIIKHHGLFQTITVHTTWVEIEMLEINLKTINIMKQQFIFVKIMTKLHLIQNIKV